MGRLSMQSETSLTIPKEGPSERSSSSEETWWDRAKKPSRQRNLTPLQRKSLAISLRSLRRHASAGTLDDTEWYQDRTDPFDKSM
jgi:hypothetical protein